MTSLLQQSIEYLLYLAYNAIQSVCQGRCQNHALLAFVHAFLFCSVQRHSVLYCVLIFLFFYIRFYSEFCVSWPGLLFFGSSAQFCVWINSFALVVEINKPHKDTIVSRQSFCLHSECIFTLPFLFQLFFFLIKQRHPSSSLWQNLEFHSLAAVLGQRRSAQGYYADCYRRKYKQIT